MILLNVALPGFTYAEDATAPFTVTMSANEVTDNKVTVEVKYPADINADLIGKKWIDAEIVPEQAIPAGTEVTIKYTLSNSE